MAVELTRPARQRMVPQRPLLTFTFSNSFAIRLDRDRRTDHA
jgi:hypothetical protein